jgi:hypothetical protein
MTVAEVDAVAQAFHDGLANQDASALADIYHEDARLLPPAWSRARVARLSKGAMQQLLDMGHRSLDLEPFSPCSRSPRRRAPLAVDRPLRRGQIGAAWPFSLPQAMAASCRRSGWTPGVERIPLLPWMGPASRVTGQACPDFYGRPRSSRVVAQPMRGP